MQFQSTPPVKAATRHNSKSRQRGLRFQSTPPVKAATTPTPPPAQEDEISIHAAREGGDVTVRGNQTEYQYFNPRRP